MNKNVLKFLLYVFFLQPFLFGQFGQNKVQYKNYTWYFIQTDHFDIYFSQHGSSLAEFASKAAEDALKSIEKSFNYQINNRIVIIIYNSTNDFQETNLSDESISEGIEGFTEIFKNRVVVQFMGSYKEFRHLIHHELTHAVMNDMLYGGSLQNIISHHISINLPLWFNEGMAEYQSLGWDIDEDIFMREATISEYLPDIDQLQGYLAYRGGQSVFYYISQKYGRQKIGELMDKIKSSGNLESGLKNSIGLTLEELNDRWKKYYKKMYWPEIATMKDVEDFSKRLTDPKNGDGFYNTSPTLSPQGDKIAFISNRDYYFDVYIMNAIDGKIIKKLVQGNSTADFEQLNVVTPGLSWSPDGKEIALSAKSGGYDVVYIIDVESGDKETLPIQMDGIKSLSWSPDGKYIAFIGHTSVQSDVYIYDLQTRKIENLTNDIFTDNDPAWSPNSKKIYFSSDRRNYLTNESVPDTFKIYKFDYSQTDIYSVDINSKKIERITDLPNSDKTNPVIGPEGKEMLFISDMNGISNIYKKKIVQTTGDTTKIIDNPAIPITNSLEGLGQLSMSKDGKKLVFFALYEASYNLFLMNNPFDPKTDSTKLPLTVYRQSLLKQEEKDNENELTETKKEENKTVQDTATTKSVFSQIYTGQVVDTTEAKSDSTKPDYSNYIFGSRIYARKDSTEMAENQKKFHLTDNLDENGNYKVHPYKISFSPDIVYANAGYNTIFGLMGTTILSFSDELGDHRLIGETSLQIDLKNSDYGLTYADLGGRLNYAVSGFHTARFVYLLNGNSSELFRFGNYGAAITLSYPVNRFYRLETGLVYMSLTQDDLDNTSVPSQKASFVVPSLSLIHDDILWGYVSPIAGTRYRIDLLGNPGIGNTRLSFSSLLGDYRTYFKINVDYSFAVRFSGGYSIGGDPQRFFLGGVNNWINRQFATQDVPISSISDYAFLTSAVPLRGYEYAQEIGSKYGLLNLEFRFPLIRYFITGALPFFFSNIQGVVFYDAGAAWYSNSGLKLLGRDSDGNLETQDLLMGTGLGARMVLFGFLFRYDVGWGYQINRFTPPTHYISIGIDFD